MTITALNAADPQSHIAQEKTWPRVAGRRSGDNDDDEAAVSGGGGVPVLLTP